MNGKKLGLFLVSAVVCLSSTEGCGYETVTCDCGNGRTVQKEAEKCLFLVRGRPSCNTCRDHCGQNCNGLTQTETTCHDPGKLRNGHTKVRGLDWTNSGRRGPGSVFPEGTLLSYTCRSGYILSGSDLRLCKPTGQWTGVQPRCIRGKTCADPGSPQNGHRVLRDMYLNSGNPASGSKFPNGTLLSFSCKQGYDLVGSDLRLCKPSGKWTGVQPRCVLVCGKSFGARATKVINGRVSLLGEYPWQVFLAFRRTDGTFFGGCGGSLVSDNWVVTAAHCVTEYQTKNLLPIQDLKIYLGKYYRDDAKDDQFVQEFTVSEIHLAPHYDPVTIDSDVALLKLSSPANLTERVMPICLPKNSLKGARTAEMLIKPGSYVTATGWGAVSNTDAQSAADVLQSTRVMTINNTDCQDKYSKNGITLVVTSSMFCAGHDDGRTDTCLGDSGGPAVANIGDGLDRLWYLVGVVSWGSPQGCAVAMQYGGYARVSQFIDFIYKTTKI